MDIEQSAPLTRQTICDTKLKDLYILIKDYNCQYTRLLNEIQTVPGFRKRLLISFNSMTLEDRYGLSDTDTGV